MQIRSAIHHFWHYRQCKSIYLYFSTILSIQRINQFRLKTENIKTKCKKYTKLKVQQFKVAGNEWHKLSISDPIEVPVEGWKRKVWLNNFSIMLSERKANQY